MCSEEEDKLQSLPFRNGGLGIPIPREITPKVFENSIKLTKALLNQIAGRPSKTAETQSMIKSDIKK